MGEREPRKETGQTGESILARAFVEPILAEAKEALKIYGRLEESPLFLQFESGERGVIPIALPETHEEKLVFFTALGLTIRISGHTIREALLVSEVWYVEPPIDVAPSQHPSRKEAIAIAGRDSQGNRFTSVLQPFSRDAQNQPVYEQMVVEEYNVSPETGLRSAGLVDYLFDLPDARIVRKRRGRGNGRGGH